MLKNIIFDFGNVLIDYDPDKIIDHYDVNDEERAIFKKNIFGSKEWLEVDAGRITEMKLPIYSRENSQQNCNPRLKRL